MAAILTGVKWYWDQCCFWLTSIPSIPLDQLLDVSWSPLSLLSVHVDQSDLNLGFLGGRGIQTWWIGTAHLLDHSDWFRNGHGIQVGPVILNPKSFSELRKRSSLLRMLSSVGWKAQTNRAQHIKWASRRMKPVQRKMEPNDGETWVLMTTFVPLDQTVPEASISPGLFSYVNQ